MSGIVPQVKASRPGVLEKTVCDGIQFLFIDIELFDFLFHLVSVFVL